MFLQVSVCPHGGGGACMVLFGRGGMCGFIWGACMVLFGGACMVLFGGACIVLFGGACVVLFGGHAWFYLGGACMVLFGGAWVVLFGGHAWFYLGGACVVLFRGARHGFFSFSRYNEIRSMSGRYTSYWNASLFVWIFCTTRRGDAKTSSFVQAQVLVPLFTSPELHEKVSLFNICSTLFQFSVFVTKILQRIFS